MVEQRPFKPLVLGSSPSTFIFVSPCKSKTYKGKGTRVSPGAPGRLKQNRHLSSLFELRRTGDACVPLILHVKAEIDDIAVLNDVGFAFQPHLAGGLDRLFISQFL